MPRGWLRPILILVCLGVVAFFVVSSGEDPAPQSPEGEASKPGDFDVNIPLPSMPEAEPIATQARGAYVLETAEARVSLELMKGRHFRFISTRGAKVREAVGTWSLAGRRLTLAYTHIDGAPVGQEPTVVANVWNGTTIELRDTGLPGRVILTKRTMIRNR